MSSDSHNVKDPAGDTQSKPRMPDQLLVLSSKESRALMACALGEKRARNQVRWPAIIEVARYHRVAPLMAECLEEKPLTEEARARLEDFNSRSSRRIDRACQGLSAILKEANARNIPLLVFKGPALAGQLYDRPEVRTYYDIDLAVRREDLERAESLMRDVGFVMPPLKAADLLWMVGRRPDEKADAPLSEAETRQLWLANHFHMPFVPRHPDQGVRVDLHWALFQSSRLTLPIKDLWKRATPIEILGHKTLTFSLPDSVIYLCLHAAVEGFYRLRLIKLVDIYKACSRLSDEDWANVGRRCRHYGVEREFSVGLQVAYQAFGRELPPAAAAIAAGGLRMSMLKAALNEKVLLACKSPVAKAAWDWALGKPCVPVTGHMVDSLARLYAKRLLGRQT